MRSSCLHYQSNVINTLLCFPSDISPSPHFMFSISSSFICASVHLELKSVEVSSYFVSGKNQNLPPYQNLCFRLLVLVSNHQGVFQIGD